MSGRSLYVRAAECEPLTDALWSAYTYLMDSIRDADERGDAEASTDLRERLAHVSSLLRKMGKTTPAPPPSIQPADLTEDELEAIDVMHRNGWSIDDAREEVLRRRSGSADEGEHAQ